MDSEDIREQVSILCTHINFEKLDLAFVATHARHIADLARLGMEDECSGTENALGQFLNDFPKVRNSL